MDLYSRIGKIWTLDFDLSRFYQDELRLYEYGLQLFNGMIQHYGEKYVDAEKRYRELRSKQKVLVHTADWNELKNLIFKWQYKKASELGIVKLLFSRYYRQWTGACRAYGIFNLLFQIDVIAFWEPVPRESHTYSVIEWALYWRSSIE